MTPQEEQLLNSLVERINQTQLQEKDPDAEGLLNQTLGRNPDALYILAQTVLVQNIALEQAKAQVQQQQKPAHATSFLGSLLGRRDPDPEPAPQAQIRPQQFQPAPGYQPVNPQYTQAPPPYGQPQYIDPQYGYGPPPSQPSFLRGAMQTAAGVAAGALAFEGVESVLHGLGGFGHPGYGWGGGFGGGMMGGGMERPVEETVINNYYDDPNARGLEHHGLESGGERHFHESGDHGGAQYSDASYNTADNSNELAANNDDVANYDNSGSGFDDLAGVDDGGSFDNSGGDVL